MARGSRVSRGFRGSRSSRSSGSRAGRAGARKGSRKQRPKGQLKGGSVVQYAVKSKNGKTTYIGSTNNPTRRASEHRKSGKMRRGDKMEVQSRALPRDKAERLERGRLKGHRRAHGRNPQHNKTSDGQYHLRRNHPS